MATTALTVGLSQYITVDPDQLQILQGLWFPWRPLHCWSVSVDHCGSRPAADSAGTVVSVVTTALTVGLSQYITVDPDQLGTVVSVATTALTVGLFQ